MRVPTGTFLLHHKALARRFRTLVKNAITDAYEAGTLVLPPHIAPDRTVLDLLLARASKTDWVTYLKPPFGGPEHVLAYLAAYTHRVAISNRRILAFDGDRVTFAYRDSRSGNAQKSMELPAPSSFTDSFCTSFRRDSPVFAITDSSRIATAPPTSHRLAPSSVPRASSALVILHRIYVYALSATTAR